MAAFFAPCSTSALVSCYTHWRNLHYSEPLHALPLSARIASAPYVCHYGRPLACLLTVPPPPLAQAVSHSYASYPTTPCRYTSYRPGPTDQPIHPHLTFPGTPTLTACCIRSGRTHTLTASPLTAPPTTRHVVDLNPRSGAIPFTRLSILSLGLAVLSEDLASLTIRTTPGIHQAGAVCPGAADVRRRTPSTCVPADM